MKDYFETNPKSKMYLDRLVNEWSTYGKIIVACDFDDTISPWRLDRSEFDFDIVINLLKEVKKTGAYITIFTACDSSRYDEISSYCSKNGLEIDSININPIELPYGNNGKVYANIFLDDRAGLNESLNILERAMYLIRASKLNLKYDL